MILIRQLIGVTTLALVGILFLLADLLTHLVIVPLVRVRPAARQRILGRWSQALRRAIIALVSAVGRARFEIGPEIPGHGGVLVVMNHQSLLDIPIAFACVPSSYPRVVTHARYGRGIPLVSSMIALYGHIPVYPGRTGREELERLAGAARSSPLPVVIFPEGHRTRDGEIRPWKRAGLEAILSAREWTVYVVVLDGLWRAARLPDFVRNLTGVHCRVEGVGPFAYDGRGRAEHTEFVDHLHRVMCDKLAAMRSASGSSASGAAASAAKEGAAGAVRST
jgi:1-acyl-sn-glycerol-3-phosphate acyltransferase